MKLAAEHFLSAALLADNPQSNEIIATLTQGKGIFSVFANTEIAFSDWNDIKIFFRKKLGSERFDAAEEAANLLQTATPPTDELDDIDNNIHDAQMDSNINSELMILATEVLDAAFDNFDQFDKKESFSNNAKLRSLVQPFLRAYCVLKDTATRDIFYNLDDPMYDPYYGLKENFHSRGMTISNWDDACQVWKSWIGEEGFAQELDLAKQYIADCIDHNKQVYRSEALNAQNNNDTRNKTTEKSYAALNHHTSFNSSLSTPLNEESHIINPKKIGR